MTGKAAVAAATVVLLRDAGHGLETLLLRRAAELAFAGDMWVFPGGRVDDADRRPGDDEIDAARRAAVREAFEEAGIRVEPDALAPYSHWTPPPQARGHRFSTWFFVAGAPDGATRVTVDGGEILEHCWIAPAEALARRDAGTLGLTPPTWVTLFELAAHLDVAAALAAASKRTPPFYETHIVVADGTLVATWADDAAYADGDLARPGPRHRLAMHEDGWAFERA